MIDHLLKSSFLRRLRALTAALSIALLGACDPLVSLQGSFWPPWIVVMVAALPMTWLAHAFFKRLGLAGYLQPPLLIYPSLWALMTFLAWLMAFPW